MASWGGSRCRRIDWALNRADGAGRLVRLGSYADSTPQIAGALLSLSARRLGSQENFPQR